MLTIGYLAFCKAHVEIVRSLFDRMNWRGIEIVVTKTNHDSSGKNIAETVLYLKGQSIPYTVEPRRKYDVLMSCVIQPIAVRKQYGHAGTKLVRIMYSSAGKNYTYGPDNAVFDLILTVGPYAEKRLSSFAPCVSVGMPRFDDLHSGKLDVSALKQVANIGQDRPLLLYLPTWGAESSIARYREQIIGSSKDFIVIVKPHPLTYMRERHRLDLFKDTKVRLIPEDCSIVELLAMADLVISDYSGSIFEDMAADKPILLLDVDDDTLRGSHLHEEEGPEHRFRDMAPRVCKPTEYEARLAEALRDEEPWPTRRRAYADMFFACRDGTSSEKAATAIRTFMNRNRYRIVFGRWWSSFRSRWEIIQKLYEWFRPHSGGGRSVRRCLSRPRKRRFEA